ncbi:MAG: DUF6624 domain-containing protein [Rickettsiales bacterium]
MLISTDLLTMFALKPLEKLDPPEVSPAWAESSLAFLANIHRPKSDALKTIVEEHGWPTENEFSGHAHEAAFMIVLHADYDVEFQTHCHKLLLELASLDKVDTSFIAFLTDRILCNKGLHQRFGTQIREAENGCFVPKPLENSDKVDELRSAAGIEENMFDYYQRVNGGDMLLPRYILGEYADVWEPPNNQPTSSGSSVVEFPGNDQP